LRLKAVDTQEQPPVVVDPRTGQEYLLIRREVYEIVRGTVKPYGRAWDDSGGDGKRVRNRIAIIGS
jgi:hypothetical protein